MTLPKALSLRTVAEGNSTQCWALCKSYRFGCWVDACAVAQPRAARQTSCCRVLTHHLHTARSLQHFVKCESKTQYWLPHGLGTDGTNMMSPGDRDKPAHHRTPLTCDHDHSISFLTDGVGRGELHLYVLEVY